MPIAIARAAKPATATALGEGEHVGVVRIGFDWRTTPQVSMKLTIVKNE